MSIKHSPGCPCCSFIFIAAGVYCNRWGCDKEKDINGNTVYIPDLKLYLPPQKITLWRLGYGQGKDFKPDEKELVSDTMVNEVSPSGGFLHLPVKYMTPEWIGDDNKLNIDAIEEDINKDNGVDDDHKSLDGYPCCILYHNKDIVNNTTYKLIFDLDKYGVVDIIFYIGLQKQMTFYKILRPSSFPKQVAPGTVGTVSGNQDLEYTCCPPCIIKYTSDIEVKIEYSNLETGDLSFDQCICGNAITTDVYYYYPYYHGYYPDPYTSYLVCEDVPEEGRILYHSSTKNTDVKTEITAICKWDGDGWTSDQIDLRTVRSDTSWHEGWCFEVLGGGGCTCYWSQLMQVKIHVPCHIQYDNDNPYWGGGGFSGFGGVGDISFVYGYRRACTTRGDVQSYNIRQDFNRVPLESVLCNGFQWDAEYGSITYCNLDGSFFRTEYYPFTIAVINPECEQLQGSLLGIDPGDTYAYSGIRGTISGG